MLLDKYVGGCSVADIAAQTGRSAKAVESLLSRARASSGACCDLTFRLRRKANAMNRPTPGPLDDDEEELMRELVSEAGDPAVAPRPEFVAGLRQTIFNRLDPPRLTRRRVRLLIGSVFAAAAVVAVVLTVSLFRPGNAWAQVAKALQAQAWVHSRTLGPDGKEFGEGWFSPKNRVIAVRHGDGGRVPRHDASDLHQVRPRRRDRLPPPRAERPVVDGDGLLPGAARPQGAEQIATVWHGSGRPDPAEG